MSLYIGNLPARPRREELERVFQRFGQCEVRIKDGYGFVVYSFAPQAEKAMKMLQGRNICGQQLTITWSNKQPRPVQRNPRGARSFKPRGRNFGTRNIPSNYRDPVVDNHFVEGEGDDVTLENADNGRWGERADVSTDDTIFDRYEPYHGGDRKDEDEGHLRENSEKDGSTLGSSQDRIAGERADDSKFKRGCFNCGASGHKILDCPKKNPSRGIFTRFDRSRDSGDIKRFQTKVRGKIQSRWGNIASNNSRELRMTNISPERSRGKKLRKSTLTSSRFRSASKPLSISSSSSSKSRSSKPLNPNPRSRSSSLMSLSLSVSLGRPNRNSKSDAEKPDADSRNEILSASISESDKPAPMSISLEEMCGALKQYGLKFSELEIGKNKSVQSFFGSARLWPWESVFYRRAKKGPISVENYARRVAQNEEFGIVDKFVRSSSGWGEMCTETP